MDKKRCSVCGSEKPLDQYQVRRASKDGRTAACRECLRQRDRERFQKEKKKRREWSRRYYAGKGKEVVKACRKRWQEKNIIKRAAHIMVNNAVRDGKLKKPDNCALCWKTDVPLHGHHDDYTKPLDVRWLCKDCHAEWHEEHGEGLNG